METAAQAKRRDELDFWVKELEAAKKWHREWRDKAEKVFKRYTDAVPYNILYSNIETLEGALLQDIPKPAVTRRYKSSEPLARQGADVLERALEYQQSEYNFAGSISYAVRDYLLPGVGQIRVRYDAQIGDVTERHAPEPVIDVDESGMESTRYELDGNPVEPQWDGDAPYVELTTEQVTDQVLRCENVPWERFLWQPAKNWAEVEWCAIEHHMAPDDLRKNFPYKWSRIQLTVKEDGTEHGGTEKALIWEIFDKTTRRIIFISPGYKDGVLKIQEDELEIEGFFPFPEPLFATLTSRKLCPIPDYLFYQDQAEELNTLTERLRKVIDALKVRGVYDASFASLQNVLQSRDNDMVPISDFAHIFQGKGDLSSVLMFMPLEELQRVAIGLYEARDRTKQVIYEITGISDIVRGDSNAQETATAQRIKGQFASLRLRRRQQAIQRFIGDVYKIKAEIIANHFSAEKLTQMTGIPVDEGMEMWLRDDALRNYKVAVDTDSMVMADEEQEKQTRMEFMSNFVGLYSNLAGMVAQGLMQPDLARESLMFMARGFRGARQFEETLEQAFVVPEQPPMPPQMPQAGAMPPEVAAQMDPAMTGNVVPFSGVA